MADLDLVKDTQLELHPDLIKYLEQGINNNASDLHLSVSAVPALRIDGKLHSIEGTHPLNTQDLEALIESMLSEEQKKKLISKKELDFSLSFKEKVRLRINVYYEKGNLAAAFRLIPYKIKTIEELGLPPILERFSSQNQGLVIVTGPTGHGKSTTLAAMVDYINKTRASHVITIEDPIEYVFQNNKSLIKQREVGTDTKTFTSGLRSSLREDPNVVLVGEMRDLESIETALILAETGHLIITTLHANNAAETADRVVSVFPPHQQQQIRFQLANVLTGVISQRLIPKISGGRVPVAEIMISNHGIRNIIREGKTYQLTNVINTSMSEGMISMDKVLADMVSKGEISIENALVWATDPKNLKMSIY
jgi:twitching motility protein PilT